ncbi:MAG: PIN domain-containing protein [Fibrobacterota bacterium]
MTLVDTSVWVNYFNGKRYHQTDLLTGLISQYKDICVCGLVLTEILQGIKSDDEFEKVKKQLSALIYLPVTKHSFIQAASLYRSIRKHGKTIRSSIDCIISSICIEHEVRLLHDDRDFDIIAKYSKLKISK